MVNLCNDESHPEDRESNSKHSNAYPSEFVQRFGLEEFHECNKCNDVNNGNN